MLTTSEWPEKLQKIINFCFFAFMPVNNKKWWIVFFVLLGLSFLAHLPFMKADPDVNLSFSRGPWTDEGLYSVQVRNYINTGDLTFYKTDGFVKTPGFSVIQFISYKVFGISLVKGRMTVLLLFSLILIMASKIHNFIRNTLMIMIPIGLWQYHIFHFSHLCLADVLSIGCVLLSVSLIYKWEVSDERKGRWLLLSALCISVAYYIKIRYVYVIAVPSLYFSFRSLYVILKQKKFTLDRHLASIQYIGYTLLFFGLYFTLWYLPNKELMDHIFGYQMGARFIEFKYIPGVIYHYHRFIFLDHTLFPLFTVCALCIVMGTIQLFKQHPRSYKILFLLGITWLLVESHKLSLAFLPPRYLLGMYFAFSMVVASSLLLVHNSFGKKHKVGSFLLFGVVLGIPLFQNMIVYIESMNHRTYALRDLNTTFAETNFKDKTALGFWAPSLTWDTKVKALPVWEHYFNDKNIKGLNPKVIITDSYEPEPWKVYEKDGFNLEQQIDSITKHPVGHWDVIIAWVKD